ncbi:MAG: dephospho-CoA kinase [Ruminococcaceae bacterium]|nr:dephospho-CoA kinase [Oscillospiraceae bacterium]
MRLIGVCGRSGCGKSIFCDIARQKGLVVIDCDKVYRELVSKPSQCLAELEIAFGNDIIENGALNRKKLASIVFNSAEKLALLNEITHKHIIDRVDEILSTCAEDSVVLLDAPTLFESGISDRCELIIGITASDEACVSRITERDNLTETQALERLSNQKSTEFFLENCDIIIYNETTLTDFKTASEEVLEELMQ